MSIFWVFYQTKLHNFYIVQDGISIQSGNIFQKILNVQCLISTYRVEISQKINKRTCTYIRKVRVAIFHHIRPKKTASTKNPYNLLFAFTVHQVSNSLYYSLYNFQIHFKIWSLREFWKSSIQRTRKKLTWTYKLAHGQKRNS